jgi:hypothetical protein
MTEALTDHDQANHDRHLCKLVENGQMNLVAQLTLNPEYMCGTCGRTATSGENLCDPIKREGLRLGDPRKWEGLAGPDTPPSTLADHDSDSHQLHLCELVGNRLMGKAASLARDAKHICRTCGRVASSADSLCSPVPLFD